MTGFCKRLLFLAAGSLAFAAASYGQNIVSCANTTPQAVFPGPLNLRDEGTTELVGDVQFSCSNTGAPTATGAVSTFLSAPVTSKVLPPAGPATEATLFVCTAAPCTATNASATISGTVAGQQISFANVAFPAGTFFGRISNVRVNANAVTLSTTLTTVTEQVLASANGTSGNTLPTTVGYVFKSLNNTGLVSSFAGPILNGFANGFYTTCVGNPIGPTKPTLSFTVTGGEVFGGAFKALTPPPDGTPTENGSYIAGAAGTATFGTRIMLTFAGVSSGMTVFVPTSISTTAGLTMTLTSSATGAFAAVSPSTSPFAPGALGAPGAAISTTVNETYAASAGFTPTNGSVTVVYEVFDAPAANILGYQVPVWVGFAANAFTTAQGPITVSESYAPVAAASAATTIPNFAATGTTVNAVTVVVCQTNLLFPFLTSSQGFDTGIVLANTSTDIFGTAPAPGSCTLNFYGSGAPSPATGVASPGGSQASGTVNAFLLSSIAPGFTGYVIAQCNYQYGYGYAFIENGLGSSSGVAEGYIAPNINPRPAGGFAIIGQ